MSTVILLGYRQPLAEAIERHGEVPFSIVERDVPGLKEGQFCRVSDLEDVQEVLRAVASSDLSDVKGVVTGHEQGVFSAAVLRDELRLPGCRDHARASVFRDKYLQKSRLAADIPRARCRYVTSRTRFDELSRDLGLPFVVKPAAGFGSIRTSVVRSEDQFHELLLASEKHRFLGTLATQSSDVAFVAESFVSGRELHVDGIWQDGALQWAALGRYREPLVQLAAGHVLVDYIASPEQSAESLRRAVALAEKSLASLETPDCIFHMEAFEDEERTAFSECAMRLSGTQYPELLEMTYGVNLFDAEVSLSLGEKATVAPHEPEQLYGYIHLRQDSGSTLRKENLEELFPFVQLEYPARDDAPWRTGKIGLGVVAHSREDMLAKLLEDIASFNEEAVPVGSPSP
ncbi:acetyl-CoA carboxylase biotin carboxylase subunit family protein [Streptomyces sp. NPDC087263]|uniref:ATP-grasp domain-containing protein n=1 Tax=Streptomyces sp. NPDC087263 TaxID=3365773 RepID=UPI0037F3D666